MRAEPLSVMAPPAVSVTLPTLPPLVSSVPLVSEMVWAVITTLPLLPPALPRVSGPFRVTVSVARLPLTAASRPRLGLRFRDSCGESIGVVASVSVWTGCDGLDMSRTATPSDPAPGLSALSGNISVVS